MWSPLAFGILTDKYAQGGPENARLAADFLCNAVGDVGERAAHTEKLRPIAKTLAQLDENLQAFPVVAKITPEIKAQIEAIMPFQYKPPTRDFYYTLRGKYL